MAQPPSDLCAHDVLMMSALWSSTLYLMLPETKARYAVYTFIGFLPLLEAAVNEDEPTAVRVRAFAEVVFCVILIGGLLPDPPKVYGIGIHWRGRAVASKSQAGPRAARLRARGSGLRGSLEPDARSPRITEASDRSPARRDFRST